LLICPAAPPAPTTYDQTIRPLLDTACAKCHGEKKQKGSIDFGTVADLAAAMKKHKLWVKVAEQVKSGDMPPDDEPQLTPEQKRDLLAWIEHSFDTSKSPDPGPPLVRQLTRAEYNNTLRDLLGITNFDPARAGGIPEEEVVEGYANAAEAMSLNEALLEKYFAAAEGTLNSSSAKTATKTRGRRSSSRSPATVSPSTMPRNRSSSAS